jgi:lactate permease
MWNQPYSLFGQGTVISALLASIPILVVLVLLGVMRKPAWMAALAGLGTTLVLAVACFGMPIPLAFSSATYGAAFGLFPISWIIFSALVLFRISTETGQFEILRDTIGHLTEDPRLQALLIAFAFGAFLEGAAGFGTPVAIAAAMLTGLGFSPFRAAAICLLANTAPVAFGSIGIPVITLGLTTGLPLARLSAAVGRICTPVALIIPAYLIFAIGGMSNLRAVWVPAVAAGVTFGAVQYVVSNFIGPQLTDILASLASVGALILCFRYVRVAPCSEEDAVRFRGVKGEANVAAAADELRREEAGAIPHYSAGVVFRAWLPYILLVCCVLLWGYKPFTALLDRATFAVRWPMLHDLVVRLPPVAAAPSPYHALFNFNLLSASGTSCLLAGLLSAVFLGVRPKQYVRIVGAVLKQIALPTLTVASVLAMAFVMNYSGATATLGLAFAATGAVFPFFSAILGWLGVFLTGSDTSANALFGNLQVITATKLNLNPIWTAAANSSGGVMGKMISLQTIAVAAAATKMHTDDQARLFRFTLKHSVLLALLVGCIALLFTYTWAI